MTGFGIDQTLEKKELDVKFSTVVVRGAWEANPGSGKEDQYKKGDTCIAFINGYGELIRLEDLENKEKIRR